MKNSLLRKIIPNSLFARFTLIIIIPTLITQIFATFMFYHRHWDNVISHMITSLSGEIKLISNSMEYHYPEQISKNIHSTLGIETEFFTGQKILMMNYSDELLERLHNSLEETIKLPINVFSVEDSNYIKVNIQLENGVLSARVHKKRIDNPTTYIYIMWMTGTSSILFILAVLFSKNQIKPIIRLARAADQFGKGQTISKFKISGASEVRKASRAFLTMKDRIERQITQRTEMLASISHDLRTPLTRMKLQLEIAKDNEFAGIKEDITDMENMIKAYLDFVNGEDGEENKETDLEKLVAKLVEQFRKTKFDLSYFPSHQSIKRKVRRNALSRALSNLIENATKYSSKATIRTYLNDDYFIIELDDNGLGIPANKRYTVFKPFYRLERSRNKHTGGFGLGLSIARDIIVSHGGEVELSDSKELGGLKVIVKLPI
jgi:two-component system, OmpR family, osmolarity sensor histidine kinase EnvZ